MHSFLLLSARRGQLPTSTLWGTFSTNHSSSSALLLSSVVEVDDWELPIDDLVAVQERLAPIQIPHLHAEQVLF